MDLVAFFLRRGPIGTVHLPMPGYERPKCTCPRPGSDYVIDLFLLRYKDRDHIYKVTICRLPDLTKDFEEKDHRANCILYG